MDWAHVLSHFWLIRNNCKFSGSHNLLFKQLLPEPLQDSYVTCCASTRVDLGVIFGPF
jgi:hypothetical protein